MRYDVTNSNRRTPYGFYSDVPPNSNDLARGSVALSKPHRVMPGRTVYNAEIPDAVLVILKQNKFLQFKKSNAASAIKAQKIQDAFIAKQQGIDPNAKPSRKFSKNMAQPVQNDYEQYMDEEAPPEEEHPGDEAYGL
jgi:hypothetical protein